MMISKEMCEEIYVKESQKESLIGNRKTKAFRLQ